MTANAVRAARIFLTAVTCVAAFLLEACGNSNQVHVCNASSCCGSSDLCPAPQYLYAAGLDGQVTSYSFNGTGALTSPVSVSGPTGSFGMAVLDNAFLYASQPGGSVDAWSINLGADTLTAVAGSPFSLGSFSVAGGIAVNNNAQVVYVADAGKIDALKADSSGALSALAGSPFLAGTGLYLTTDNQDKFLFASDTTPPGNVLAYTVDSTGALTAVAGSPFATISASPSDTEPNQIVVDSTGKFVYVGLMATDQVAGFAIDASTGGLTLIPGSPFPAGKGPLVLVTVNNFLYVANSQDGTLSGFKIDSTTGMLTPIAGSPFAISAAALTTNNAGNFLFVSGATGLAVFSINTTSGALSEVGTAIPNAIASALAYVL